VNLDSVGYVVGRKAFQDATRAASAAALVLLRDSTGILDSTASGRRRITMISYGEANAGTVGGVLAGELRRRGHEVTAFRLYPTSGPASYDSARTALDGDGLALFAVSVRARESKGSIAMPEPLGTLMAASSRPVLLVSFGSPYIISQAPSVSGYLLAWLANPFTERAVAEALAGAAITGKLPVEIPPGYQIGAGVQRQARP